MSGAHPQGFKMKAFGRALSAAVVASGAVVSAQAFGKGCPCALSNVDYYGHDVDKIFKGPATECPENCQKACQENTYCHYFTYITDRRECYLKDADASRDPKYHATAVSGPKFCGNTPPHVHPPSMPPQKPSPNPVPPVYFPKPPMPPQKPQPPVYVPKPPMPAPNPFPPVYIPKPPVPAPEPFPPVYFPKPPMPTPPPPATKPCPPHVVPDVPQKPSFDTRPLCFEDNVDYFGYDLKKYENGAATTPLACQQLCAQEPNCFYWTFTRGDHSCYLKNREAPLGRKTNTNAISGPRACNMAPHTCFEKDVNYYGCDIRAVEGHLVISPDECQKICQAHPDCRFWTWVSSQRNCYLKGDGAPQGRTQSAGSVSGPQTCDGSIPPRVDPPRYPPYGVPPQQCLEHNVEYVSGTFRLCEAANLKACQARCRAEPQCEYVTFKLDLLECALKDNTAVNSKAYRKFTYSTSKLCDLNQQPDKPCPDGKPFPAPPVFPPYLDGRPVPELPHPMPPFLDAKPVPPPEIPRPFPPFLDAHPVPPSEPMPPMFDGKPVQSAPDLSCVDVNVEYTGSTIGSTSCNSVATCQRVCQLTAGCHYFSYVEHLRQCNLKGEKGIARPSQGIISGPECCTTSGVPSAPDTCYHYAVIIGDTLGSDVAYSAPICQNLCMNKPGCAYFTYSLNNGECVFFKNKFHHVASPFSISGLRACSGGPVDTDWGFPNTQPPQLPSYPAQPPTQLPSAGCTHANVDFTGHNVGVETVDDVEYCRAACVRNVACHCFTFVSHTKQCYLKSETGLVHRNKGCISGLKFCS